MKLLWRWLLIAVTGGFGLWLAIWLHNHQGTLRIVMFGYEVVTPVWLALLGLCIILLILIVPLSLFWQFRMWRKKRHFNQKISQHNNGLYEITQIITALSLGELKEAEKHLRLAQKSLGSDNELNQLLEAHLMAKIGNYAGLNLSFEKMQHNPATKMLAGRALLQTSLLGGNLQKALIQAKNLYEQSPKNPVNSINYLCLLLKNAQFPEAYLLYKSIIKHKIFNKIEALKLRAIIYLSEFEYLSKLNIKALDNMAILECDDDNNNNNLLQQSFDIAPFFAATYQYLKVKKDWKNVIKAWRENPNAELTDIILSNYIGEEKTKIIKWLQKLIALNPMHIESQILQANICILNEDYVGARNYLKSALAISPQRRIYGLLAKIEEQSGAELQAINYWLNKQSEAKKNPAWLCNKCGHLHQNWQLECDNCHGFATIDLLDSNDIAQNKPNIGLLFN